MQVRIIVAGGRDFYDHPLLSASLDKIISEYPDCEIVIVSGRAQGADLEGEAYARRKEYKIRFFPADWKRYGKAAGHIRNEDMAKNAEVLVAFWNGSSSGTKNMIDFAEKYSLKTYVIPY